MTTLRHRSRCPQMLLPARHRAPRLTNQVSDHVAMGNCVVIDHKRPPTTVSLNSDTLVLCESVSEMMATSHENLILSNDKDFEPEGTFVGIPFGTLTSDEDTVALVPKFLKFFTYLISNPSLTVVMTSFGLLGRPAPKWCQCVRSSSPYYEQLPVC